MLRLPENLDIRYKVVKVLVDRLRRKFSLTSEKSLDDAVLLSNYLFAMGHVAQAKALLERFVWEVGYKEGRKDLWGSVGYGLILLAHIIREDAPDKAKKLIGMLDERDIFTDEMTRYEVFLACLEDHQSNMDYAFTETPKYKCEVISQEALTFLYFQEMIPVAREPLPDDYAATLQALVEDCYRHLREALEESRVKGKRQSDTGPRTNMGASIMPDGAQVLYSGLLPIDYAQFYVDQLSSPEDEDYLTPDAAFIGQVNGLCGAARPGRLWLVAGPQAGAIHIDVLVHPVEPELADGYEDVVECSVSLGSDPVGLCSWAHEEVHSLDLTPGDYRVRYSIQGMDREDAEEDEHGPIPGQNYLLQFWPAPPRADEVVRQGSERAAYWHEAMPGLV